MNIPILVEPNYKERSVWSHLIMGAIDKTVLSKKYTVSEIDPRSYRSMDYDALFQNTPRLLLLIAETYDWMEQALSFFSEIHVDIVLLETDLSGYSCVKGQVTADHKKNIQMLLKLFSDCGCTRTALYGYYANSVPDRAKRFFFEKEMRTGGIESPEQLCFENRSGLADCYNAFYSRISEFDSVICVNGEAAVALAKNLTRDGIRIPEDIQIITFGGTELTATCTPKLTVMGVGGDLIGQQAVLTYRYLYHANTPEVTCDVKISGGLFRRDSTRLPDSPALQNTAEKKMPPTSTTKHRYYDDREVQELSALERFLFSCDPLDHAILQHLVRDISYDEISEILHLSKNAVFYRVKRIKGILGLQTLEELKQFLTANNYC